MALLAGASPYSDNETTKRHLKKISLLLKIAGEKCLKMLNPCM